MKPVLSDKSSKYVLKQSTVTAAIGNAAELHVFFPILRFPNKLALTETAKQNRTTEPAVRFYKPLTVQA